MTARGRAVRRRWTPHLLLGAILIAELLVWTLRHRSDAEIERAWSAGDVRAKLAAFHLLTNRDRPDPARFGTAFARELLDAPQPRIRELAFTNEVCKFAFPAEQFRLTSSLPEVGLDRAWRAYVIHRRKVGGAVVVGGAGGQRLQRRELGWWQDAIGGRRLDHRELLAHLRARARQPR